MEEERRINWIGLFIKMIIVFVFILIIVWLISKIAGKNKLSETFTNNINNMETVAVDYFKEIDLPQEKGKSTKITLKELIDKELIVSVNKEGKNVCDTQKSYSKITRDKKNYIVETTLKCGKEKDTITKKFSFKDCKNCTLKETKKETKKENKKTSSTTKKENKNKKAASKDTEENNNSKQNDKTVYYEYSKENVTYTKWVKGNVTGNNVENKYEYYSIANKTYYTLASIKEGTTSASYTIKLDNVPNDKYYFMEVTESNYFNAADENKYIDHESSSINNAKKLNVPKTISKNSLGENNFTYKLSPYYRKGSFYIDVVLNINNTSNVKPYTNENTNTYFVPLKVDIKFASNEITSTKPSGEYETISYYRYKEVNKETIWSKESSVEGYTQTGNKKYE